MTHRASGIAQVTYTLRLGTGVTFPIQRIYPAVIAQPAATIGVSMPGRFFLGVGTGENLNEHITGENCRHLIRGKIWKKRSRSSDYYGKVVRNHMMDNSSQSRMRKFILCRKNYRQVWWANADLGRN